MPMRCSTGSPPRSPGPAALTTQRLLPSRAMLASSWIAWLFAHNAAGPGATRRHPPTAMEPRSALCVAGARRSLRRLRILRWRRRRRAAPPKQHLGVNGRLVGECLGAWRGFPTASMTDTSLKAFPDNQSASPCLSLRRAPARACTSCAPPQRPQTNRPPVAVPSLRFPRAMGRLMRRTMGSVVIFGFFGRARRALCWLVRSCLTDGSGVPRHWRHMRLVAIDRERC